MEIDLNDLLHISFTGKLLVISGGEPGIYAQSEVIDLLNPSNSCKPWPDHPTGTLSSAGALLNDKVILCGGETPNGDDTYSSSSDCYLFTPTSVEHIHNLNVGSLYSAAIEFEGEVLYTGGYRYSKNSSKIQVHIVTISSF